MKPNGGCPLGNRYSAQVMVYLTIEIHVNLQGDKLIWMLEDSVPLFPGSISWLCFSDKSHYCLETCSWTCIHIYEVQMARLNVFPMIFIIHSGQNDCFNKPPERILKAALPISNSWIECHPHLPSALSFTSCSMQANDKCWGQSRLRSAQCSVPILTTLSWPSCIWRLCSTIYLIHWLVWVFLWPVTC